MSVTPDGTAPTSRPTATQDPFGRSPAMHVHPDYRHPYDGDRQPPRPRLAVYDHLDETAVPEQTEADTQVTERLWQIREISNRAIGSIDDLLKRTA
ncbi:hypothetical protein [Nonomuraea sp. NPDC048826]|uniref:hypothetical protein n=1 Tax=Nonomuraea sp. NPDC048826 TaxID=3364347 RepID=UPI00371015F6